MNAKVYGILFTTLVGALAHSASSMPVSAEPRTESEQMTQAQVQEAIALGVVRSSSNSAHWETITTQLSAANLSYQPLEWRQIRQVSDLVNVRILFLPSVESISTRQVNILREWVDNGGHLIVSGPIGISSAANVQNELRSLLGAFWAFSLTQPTELQLASISSSEWIEAMEAANLTDGGIIVPTGLSSRTIATWTEITPDDRRNASDSLDFSLRGSAAVVSTPQTTFLGWEWGSQTSGVPEFDAVWLKAAIARSQPTTSSRTTAQPTPDSSSAEWSARQIGSTAADSAPNTASAFSSSETQSPQAVPPAEMLLSGQIPRLTPLSHSEMTQMTQMSRLPEPQRRSPSPNTSRPHGRTSSARLESRQEAEPSLPSRGLEASTLATTPSTDGALTAQSDQSQSSASLPSRSGLSSLQYPTQPPLPQPSVTPAQPSRISPEPVLDPAEQVAPPGLDIGQGTMPITALEAIAMRQELENLIGRFESALLSANSANSNISLQVSNTDPLDSEASILIASNQDTVQLRTIASTEPSSDRSTGNAQAIVQQAQQALEQFPQRVARREFALAREEWINARELLWNNFPTDRPIAQPEIRAIWLDRGSIVRAGSRAGLAQIFDQLAAAGINTVFFETVNAGYPIYPSRVAPQQNPLTRHWDPLEAAVDLAHERGIELHAWVWVFAAGNQRHNAILNQPLDYLGPILEAHPMWANYDHRGEIIPVGQTKPFLDPANPQVRSYLLRLFEEIVSNYEVDGLQLDYIRYPFQDPSARRSYGYGFASRQQFQARTGVDPTTISPSDRHLWQQWTEFRTEQINSFVADTSRLLRQRRPELILSAAVFAISEHERIQKIQQNWEIWAQRGDVDLIVPMSYAMDTNRLQRLARPWLQEDADLGSTLIVPSIRLLNLPESATLDQIQALRDMPAGGYSLFAAENLNENLQEIFSRTQGSQTQVTQEQPIPYREPFQTASARFTALIREWSFALSNQQLWMRDPQLTEWRTHTQALATLLEELADAPSQQRVRQAQRSLDEYRSLFPDWMYLQSLSDEYRVETWDNRLEVIGDLLQYGERTIPLRQASLQP
jgi:uncharacterized lipoprotein YddW (UPF0748 family)